MTRQSDRRPKSVDEKVRNLDAHLYLLRQHVHKVHESPSHLKVIAAELRTLACHSSGTDGLLWRLTKELGVSDVVALHLPGKLKRDHPLVRGLEFMIVPVFRAGKGDPRLAPGNYSLQAMIKDGEALVAVGKPLTHEYLIKAVAQQMGSAHEDEGIEPALSQLSDVFVNGIEPYVGVLATDAELVLEVGERVLEEAEKSLGFQRPVHGHDYGDVSIVVRLQRKQRLISRLFLFRLHSYVSAVSVVGMASPTCVVFQLSKRQGTVLEFIAPYPSSAELQQDVIAALSYSSSAGEARVLSADGPGSRQSCPLGWLHAAELQLEEVTDEHNDLLKVRFLLSFERLLPSRDVRDLLDIPPSGYGLWKPASEMALDGPFPE